MCIEVDRRRSEDQIKWRSPSEAGAEAGARSVEGSAPAGPLGCAALPRAALGGVGSGTGRTTPELVPRFAARCRCRARTTPHRRNTFATDPSSSQAWSLRLPNQLQHRVAAAASFKLCGLELRCPAIIVAPKMIPDDRRQRDPARPGPARPLPKQTRERARANGKRVAANLGWQR